MNSVNCLAKWLFFEVRENDGIWNNCSTVYSDIICPIFGEWRKNIFFFENKTLYSSLLKEEFIFVPQLCDLRYIILSSERICIEKYSIQKCIVGCSPTKKKHRTRNCRLGRNFYLFIRLLQKGRRSTIELRQWVRNHSVEFFFGSNHWTFSNCSSANILFLACPLFRFPHNPDRPLFKNDCNSYGREYLQRWCCC